MDTYVIKARKYLLGIGALVAALSSTHSANATVVSLNFENIAPFPVDNNTAVGEYYNGGTSSIGTTGVNYGVSFGPNAFLLCLNSTTTFCSNASRGGIGDPASAQAALLFPGGAGTFLNVAAGFTTGFSFNYSASGPGSIGVYDGLNGTGNLLQTINLGSNLIGCGAYGGAAFCPFSAAGVTFGGTARSVSFSFGRFTDVVFDDVTLGSAVPGPQVGAVPEPASWAMLILGFGVLGGVLRRRSGSRVALTA